MSDDLERARAHCFMAGVGDTGAALCEAAGIEPDARAETIDVAGFLRLADALQ